MRLQQLYVDFLLNIGAKEVIPSKSKKYRKFVTTKNTYFLGKKGAVRVGPTIRDSKSLTSTAISRIKAKILQLEKENGITTNS